MPSLFVSCCEPDDRRLRELLAAAARHPDLEVVCSPAGGDDPRFASWYGRGLPEAVARAGRVLVLDTPGWEHSTWMASELWTALERHPGRVWFWWRSAPRELSLRPDEVRALPVDLDPAQVLDLVLAAPGGAGPRGTSR